MVTNEKRIANHLPKHVDPHESQGRVLGLSGGDNQCQTDDTCRHGQATGTQETHDSQLLPSGHLQGHGQGQRQDQDDQITDHTDHGVGQDNGSLVKTGALDTVVPEFADRVANADLDNHDGDVEGKHEGHEAVDEPDRFLERTKDAGHDPEKAHLGEICGWTVHDHCRVDSLDC